MEGEDFKNHYENNFRKEGLQTSCVAFVGSQVVGKFSYVKIKGKFANGLTILSLRKEEAYGASRLKCQEMHF